MKSIFIGFCSLLFTFGSCAQEEDSLINLLNTRVERDTHRVHTLIDFAAYHFHDNLDSCLLLIDEALVLATDLDFTRGLGFSNTAKSGYFFQKGILDSALVYANTGAEILESIGDSKHILAAYNNMAMVYNGMGKTEMAVEIYKKIYKKIESIPAGIQHAAICNNLALAYGKAEDYENAKIWYRKTYEHSKEIGYDGGVAYAYNGSASVHLILKEFDESIVFSLKSLEISEKLQMDKISVESYQNLGQAYRQMNKSIVAIEYYEKALVLAEKIDAKRNLQVIYNGLFKVYEFENNFEQALNFNKKYNAIKDSIFSEEKVKLLEELETKYETAELRRQKETTELANAKLEKENELEAIKNKQLNQEKELSELKANKNKNYLIGSIIIACIIALAGLLYFRQFRNRKKVEMAKLELEETNKRLLVENQYRESELKAIKAQMNPHFMFNALNSIQEYIILNKKELASDYLGKFADLMRLYLNQSNQSLIELEDEMKSIRLYVELEALRQEDLEFYINCDDDFLLESKVPPMLIQPYVENAIKHGLWHKKEDKKLTISFTQDKDIIICNIIDNGIGIEASKKINASKKRHSSFSTAATENRLSIIKERYGNAIDIQMNEIKNEQGAITGTKVEIRMPNNLQLT